MYEINRALPGNPIDLGPERIQPAENNENERIADVAAPIFQGIPGEEDQANMEHEFDPIAAGLLIVVQHHPAEEIEINGDLAENNRPNNGEFIQPQGPEEDRIIRAENNRPNDREFIQPHDLEGDRLIGLEGPQLVQRDNDLELMRQLEELNDLRMEAILREDQRRFGIDPDVGNRENDQP